MFSTSVSFDELKSLAPTHLQNYRIRRYLGDDLAIPIGNIAPADGDLVRALYGLLQQLFAILQLAGPLRERSFRAFLAAHDVIQLVRQIQKLGAQSCRIGRTDLLVRTIHDVRGGGLTPLLAHLQLLSLRVVDPPPWDALFFLTRDHLKIMRNAFLGLDDAKRNEDLKTKIHGTDFIVEKWHNAHLHFGSNDLRLEVDCPQAAPISECCVEFGALDRVLYNLLNNACRHTTGESIQLAIFRVPDEAGRILRFVLLNSLSTGDDARLHETDLATLFDAGVSTTGSGYGLNVAAEFVAKAFGVASTRDAVAAGYLGAKLLGDQFAVWFHWPVVMKN